jgi:ABC-type dipeptide/oligopeptide/nickel transport system permease component
VSGRGSFIARRAAGALLVLVVALNINFLLFRLAPGEATDRFARVPGMTPEGLAALREQFGLDESLFQQWLHYLGSLATGDLGISYANSQKVLPNLLQAYENTLPLVIGGVLIAFVLGVLAGVLSAWRSGGAIDNAVTAIGLVFYSAPAQWLGLLVAALFVGILPTSGVRDEFLIDPSFGQALLDRIEHLILPALTFGLVLFGQLALIVRSSLLEVMSEDYVLTARAKGLTTPRILRRHALRNAALPVLTWLGLAVGAMAAGAILTETVFSIPGIGSTMYSAVLNRDWPMLQGGFLAITFSVVLCTFLVDACYAWLDPRVAE